MLSSLYKVAPLASRKRLEHQAGNGSIYERARETQERRAQAAMQAATDHMMPKMAIEARDEHLKARLRTSARGRDSLVESAIQNALQTGAFDNLQGSGKPFAPREENPYEEMSGMGVVHRVLKHNGSAPAWVTQNRKIRDSILEARIGLEDAFVAQKVGSAFEQSAFEHETPSPASAATDDAASSSQTRGAHDGANLERQCPLAARWAAAVHAFSSEAAAINKQILKYNLIAPPAVPHMFPLVVENELVSLHLAFEEHEQRMHEAHLERRRARLRAARRNAARQHPRANPFGFGATWAMREVEMPSMFAALSETLTALMPKAKTR